MSNPSLQTVDQSPPPEAPAPPPSRGRPRLFVVLLLLVLAAPFLSILAAPGGRVLGNSQCDNPQAYYYINHFAGQCWRQGIVPLWNPYIMLGIPFLGDGEAATFHLLSFLFALLPTGAAINWLIVLSVLLTGLFSYGYFRALGLGGPAAWCGAVTFCYSSALISRIFAGHLNILLTLISMPLILMLWERYRTGGGVRHLVGIAFAYGLMILAFYPLVLYIFSLFFLLYVLIPSAAAAVRGREAALREGRAVAGLGLAVLAGVAVGSIQLLPALDFVGRSFREQSSIDFCGMFSFPPENLLTLLAPGFFGTGLEPGSPDHYWGRWLFWEMWVYAGILPLVMAAVGVWAAPRRRSLTLLACAFVFLLVGLGRNTPLFPLLYAWVPFFDVFRGSSKYLLIPLFCLITLSAWGFQSVFEEEDEARRRRMRRVALGACAVLLIVVGGLGLVVRGGDQPGALWEKALRGLAEISRRDRYFPLEISTETLQRTSACAARSLTWAAVFTLLAGVFALAAGPARWRKKLLPAAALLILADLSLAFFPLLHSFDESITRMPEEFDRTVKDFPHPYPPRILDLANPWPNQAICHEFSAVYGYTGNTLRRYNDFLNRIQDLPLENSMATQMVRSHTKHFRKLAIDACIIGREELPPGLQPIVTFGDKVLVAYEPFPRVFLAEGPRYFDTDQVAFDYVLSDASDVLRFPAVEHSGGTVTPRPLLETEGARITAFSPNRVEIEATAACPRVLVLCGMYTPHWTASVNGESRQVFPANYIFRAVEVPEGTSKVVLEYRPAPFYQGAAVSGVAVLMLLGLLGADWKRRDARGSLW